MSKCQSMSEGLMNNGRLAPLANSPIFNSTSFIYRES